MGSEMCIRDRITAASFGSFLAVVYKPGSPLKEVNELRVDYLNLIPAATFAISIRA